MTAELDHLVYAVPDLAAGVITFAEATGVTPVAGGSHPGGTANYLVGLGPAAYLEIIGPDPAVPGARPRAFGLETLTVPRLAGGRCGPPTSTRRYGGPARSASTPARSSRSRAARLRARCWSGA